MKHCPTCDRYFRNRIDRCPIDGNVLEDANALFMFQPYQKPGRDDVGRSTAPDASTHTDEVKLPQHGHLHSAPAPGVHDNVPPHDDWESWGARLTDDGLPRSNRRPDLSRSAPPPDRLDRVDHGRSNVSKLTERLRENARAQWFELAAAAFGFGTLGFLLHVMATAPVKSNSQAPAQTALVAITPPSSDQSSPTIQALDPVRPQSWGNRPHASTESKLLRRNPVAARGASPEARVARVRGVPRRTTVAHRDVPASTVHVASTYSPRRRYAHVQEASVDGTSLPPEKRHYLRTASTLASKPRWAHYSPHTTVHFRTASGRWDKWTPHAASLVAQPPVRPVTHRSTRPSNDDPSYEHIDGDPDREVIGLADSISHGRSTSESPHGPFGIASPQGDKHVVYVIDSSSGMGASWGRTVAEVTNSIRSLGPDDTFDLVTFNRRAHAFSSTLMPAIPGTEASIIDYMRYVRVGGEADLQQALSLAMQLPDVNDIVLVTAGPTAGETDLRRLAGFAASENRNRVRIDMVALVDGGRGASTGTLLSRIAHDSGGQSRLVNLD